MFPFSVGTSTNGGMFAYPDVYGRCFRRCLETKLWTTYRNFSKYLVKWQDNPVNTKFRVHPEVLKKAKKGGTCLILTQNHACLKNSGEISETYSIQYLSKCVQNPSQNSGVKISKNQFNLHPHYGVWILSKPKIDLQNGHLRIAPQCSPQTSKSIKKNHPSKTFAILPLSVF